MNIGLPKPSEKTKKEKDDGSSSSSSDDEKDKNLKATKPTGPSIGGIVLNLKKPEDDKKVTVIRKLKTIFNNSIRN